MKHADGEATRRLNRLQLKSSVLIGMVVLSLGLLPGIPGTCEAAELDEQIRGFLEECRTRAAATEETDEPIVRGQDGWLFLASELRHVSVGKFWGDEAQAVSRASKAAARDPLPAILDFNRQLKELGIDLLFVPVPPKVVVYPEKLSEQAPTKEGMPVRIDAQHQALYALLESQGVAVLDLTDTFLTARKDDATKGPVYCLQDSHWSARGCALAAEQIRAKIGERPWMKDTPHVDLTTRDERREITGDLYGLLKEAPPPKETLTWRVVGTGSDVEPLEADRASPVLLLADSHGLVFHIGGEMHARGAGLSDQLSLEWGFRIDTLAKRGSAASAARGDLARRFFTDEDYRNGKRLIIWCLTAREFTEGNGWSVFQITKQK